MIATAVDCGSCVKLYDETGTIIRQLRGQLVSYTPTTVTVLRPGGGNRPHLYDVFGQLIRVLPSPR